MYVYIYIHKCVYICIYYYFFKKVICKINNSHYLVDKEPIFKPLEILKVTDLYKLIIFRLSYKQYLVRKGYILRTKPILQPLISPLTLSTVLGIFLIPLYEQFDVCLAILMFHHFEKLYK